MVYTSFFFWILYDSPSRLKTLEWCNNLSNKAVVIISSPIISAQTEKDLFEVIITDCFSYISLMRLKKRLASRFSMGV